MLPFPSPTPHREQRKGERERKGKRENKYTFCRVARKRQDEHKPKETNTAHTSNSPLLPRFLPSFRETPRSCSTDEDVVDRDLFGSFHQYAFFSREGGKGKKNGKGKGTDVDQLDQIPDATHHRESDGDGAADLEVLCAWSRGGGGEVGEPEVRKRGMVGRWRWSAEEVA
jgi:hypothetical protein